MIRSPSLPLSLAICLTTQLLMGQTESANRASPVPVHPLRGAGSQPVEPFQVIGNIYYVGAAAVSSHVIATSAGLILLDTGTIEMHTGICSNIGKLGFRVEDVKIILSSHAHWDHVEGHAAMKKLTGAQVIALGEDATAIATGIDNSAIGASGWQATEVDRILQDGDVVQLGDVRLTAHLTAGHTKGCTTWTTNVKDAEKQRLVVFVGGTSINQGVRLVANRRHPSIAADYRNTFRTLKGIRADVFLAQHPAMYEMDYKRQRMIDGDNVNPFIDPDGYQRFVRAEESKFVSQLQQETAEN